MCIFDFFAEGELIPKIQGLSSSGERDLSSHNISPSDEKLVNNQIHSNSYTAVGLLFLVPQQPQSSPTHSGG